MCNNEVVMKCSKSKITLKMSTIQEVGLFAMMNAVLTFLSSYYNNIGRPLYYFGLLCLFVSAVPKLKMILHSGIVLWYFCFALCMLSSSLYSIDRSGTFGSASYVISFQLPVIVSVLVYCVDDNKIDRFFNMYMIAAVILSIIVIKDGPISSGNLRFGMTTTGEQPNTPAMNLAPAVAFALYYYRRAERKAKIKYLFAMMLFLTTIFLTGSRKIIVYIVGVFLISSLFYSQNIKKTLFKLFIVGIIIAIGLLLLLKIPVLYNSIGYRLFTDMSQEASAVHRSWLLSEAWEYFLKSPIIGHGAHTFKLVNDMGRYAHNNYAELLTGLGIVGLLAYYGYLVYLTWKLWKHKNNEYCNMMFAIMLMTFVVDWWNVNYLQRGVFFALSGSYVAYRISKNKQMVSKPSEQ